MLKSESMITMESTLGANIIKSEIYSHLITCFISATSRLILNTTSVIVGIIEKLSPDSIEDGTDNVAVTLPFIPFSTLVDEIGVESPSLIISKVIDARPDPRSQN